MSALGISMPIADLPGIGLRIRTSARGDGVRDVLRECGDLLDLDRGADLDLVAGDRRTAGVAGDLGVDAELLEHLGEPADHLVAGPGAGLVRRAGLAAPRCRGGCRRCRRRARAAPSARAAACAAGAPGRWPCRRPDWRPGSPGSRHHRSGCPRGRRADDACASARGRSGPDCRTPGRPARRRSSRIGPRRRLRTPFSGRSDWSEPACGRASGRGTPRA